MKQEDKDLLLLDLCSRLPYGVMCATIDNDGSLPNIWEIVKADMLNEDFFLIHDSYEASKRIDVKEVRPYLFPLSSMTSEQLYELREFFGFEIEFFDGFMELSTFHRNRIGYLEINSLFEWFNRNHFDYRGLINKGLAIDATGLDIY